MDFSKITNFEVLQPKVIIEPRKFYVYVYLDPRKQDNFKYGEYEFEYEPFYVGKGLRNRLYHHLQECNLKKDTNKLKINKILKIRKETGKDPIVIKYIEKLSELDALDLEKLIIKTIGRIDLKTGPLTNLTGGGDGLFNISNETKRKMGDKQRGEKNHNFGKHPTEKTKKKMRENHIENSPMMGKHHTEETKCKMSNSRKGANSPTNKYNYILSNKKNYWSFFTQSQRNVIGKKIRNNNTNSASYNGITIIRKPK